MVVKITNTHDFSNAGLCEKLSKRHKAYLVIEDPDGSEIYRYVFPAGVHWMRYSVDLLAPDEKNFYMDGPFMLRTNPIRRLYYAVLDYREKRIEQKCATFYMVPEKAKRRRLAMRLFDGCLIMAGLCAVLAVISLFSPFPWLSHLPGIALAFFLAVALGVAAICINP